MVTYTTPNLLPSASIDSLPAFGCCLLLFQILVNSSGTHDMILHDAPFQDLANEYICLNACILLSFTALGACVSFVFDGWMERK